MIADYQWIKHERQAILAGRKTMPLVLTPMRGVVKVELL